MDASELGQQWLATQKTRHTRGDRCRIHLAVSKVRAEQERQSQQTLKERTESVLTPVSLRFAPSYCCVSCRIEAGRGAARRGRGQLRDAQGRLLPANIALGQHLPSPVGDAASSSEDIRKLSPADRYLSERGTRIRRQTVCITLNSRNEALFQEAEANAAASASSSSASLPGAPFKLVLRDSVVPLLMSLSTHTSLHLIAIEPNKDRQAALIDCLASVHLFDMGLKRHRVLFCSSVKGKSAILRHIEPNLCVDDDRDVLAQLKAHLDQVLLLDPKAQAGTEVNGIPAFPSLTHFFYPQQAAKGNFA